MHKEQLDRPSVRLLWNAQRNRVTPVELDLRERDEVIAGVPILAADG